MVNDSLLNKALCRIQFQMAGMSVGLWLQLSTYCTELSPHCTLRVDSRAQNLHPAVYYLSNWVSYHIQRDNLLLYYFIVSHLRTFSIQKKSTISLKQISANSWWSNKLLWQRYECEIKCSCFRFHGSFFPENNTKMSLAEMSFTSILQIKFLPTARKGYIFTGVCSRGDRVSLVPGSFQGIEYPWYQVLVGG